MNPKTPLFVGTANRVYAIDRASGAQVAFASENATRSLVASRTDITDLARSDDPAQALLTGWRRDFMGDDLLKLLSGDLAVRIDPETGLPGRA